MKKKLVGVECLNEYICQSSNKLYADSSVILTPGARDELSRRGVTVVYGPRPESGEAPAACPPGCTCPACTAAKADSGLEQLLFAVAAMLKTEYGITDPEELKNLSCQALRTIKANL
ncbi:hypothetical protein Dde_3271 [Oleidesulfovibrio alaskensis G20]|jgi:hypothetical protein|uniref:Uncharacterized protein n=1 Tax=Oleidesulfovibrio alaskensis (strain ATCC BAA-1058 / DSM 17464 / G20) TaxID=207559 RepID=Q30W81_OLEA2|nr:hypothetical protein [Oleidesulfovibrio alaskensis]ABB40065.1 hypothetical protein Dde_3271 [Oleidesulfovibrio alaskensis G20]MBG0773867.1 hypothetical protein [Oleidesulfovibrio alaskensis]MBL3581121.1 hypothetical protein [Oleidesulfovibrio alaskensis]